MVYNPRQKDWIIFKQTARETGRELLQLEIFTSPNVAPPPDHVHPRQEEHFETVSANDRGHEELDTLPRRPAAIVLLYRSTRSSGGRRLPPRTNGGYNSAGFVTAGPLAAASRARAAPEDTP